MTDRPRPTLADIERLADEVEAARRDPAGSFRRLTHAVNALRDAKYRTAASVCMGIGEIDPNSRPCTAVAPRDEAYCRQCEEKLDEWNAAPEKPRLVIQYDWYEVLEEAKQWIADNGPALGAAFRWRYLPAEGRGPLIRTVVEPPGRLFPVVSCPLTAGLPGGPRPHSSLDAWVFRRHGLTQGAGEIILSAADKDRTSVSFLEVRLELIEALQPVE